jgi:hypothetical protein
MLVLEDRLESSIVLKSLAMGRSVKPPIMPLANESPIKPAAASGISAGWQAVRPRPIRLG